MPPNRDGKRARKLSEDSADKRKHGRNPRSNSASRLQREVRMAAVAEDVLVPGGDSPATRDRLAAEHGVTRRTLDADIAEIYSKFKAENTASIEAMKLMAMLDYDVEYAKCDAVGDRKTALQSRIGKHKVRGVFAPTKIEVSGGIDVNIGVQIEAYIEVLDADGLQAFQLVRAQIAAARAAGRLPGIDPAPLVLDAVAKEIDEP